MPTSRSVQLLQRLPGFAYFSNGARDGRDLLVSDLDDFRSVKGAGQVLLGWDVLLVLPKFQVASYEEYDPVPETQAIGRHLLVNIVFSTHINSPSLLLLFLSTAIPFAFTTVPPSAPEAGLILLNGLKLTNVLPP